MRVRRFVAAVIIVAVVVIDGLEFHDLLEPKTLPEILTGLVSIPILVLMSMDLLALGRNSGITFGKEREEHESSPHISRDQEQQHQRRAR